MNKHLKCILKLVGLIPLVIIALIVTIFQMMFMIIPGALLGVAGCVNFDICDKKYDPAIEVLAKWYKSL